MIFTGCCGEFGDFLWLLLTLSPEHKSSARGDARPGCSTVAAALYVTMMAVLRENQTRSKESEMRQHMATASAPRLATIEAERQARQRQNSWRR
jgi:hypothetical protein